MFFSVGKQGFGKPIYLRFKTFENQNTLSFFNYKIKNLNGRPTLYRLTGGS